MIITIDTAAGLSELDRATLSTLLERTGAVQTVEVNVGEVAADNVARALSAAKEARDAIKEELEKSAPRRRAAAKKVEEAPGVPAEDEPVDETPAVLEEDKTVVHEADTDVSASIEEDTPTLEDAVAAATPLISAGKGASVKKVLTGLGVKRVGELPADKIGQFIDELKGI